jgi:hypothetical protein
VGFEKLSEIVGGSDNWHSLCVVARISSPKHRTYLIKIC